MLVRDEILAGAHQFGDRVLPVQRHQLDTGLVVRRVQRHRQRDIDGFGALSDSVLSVSSKFRNHYLLVTLYRCPEMELSSAALPVEDTVTLGLMRAVITRFRGAHELRLWELEALDRILEKVGL